MNRLKLFICITAVIFGANAYAETYEEYLKAQMSEYQTYLDEIDKEFSAFLKQQWKEFNGEKPEELFEKPKPVKIPVAEPVKVLEPVKIIPKPEPKPEPDSTPTGKAEPKPAPVKTEPVVKEPVKPEPVVKIPEKKPEPEKKTEPVKEPVKIAEPIKPAAPIVPAVPVVPVVPAPVVKAPDVPKAAPKQDVPAQKAPEPAPYVAPEPSGKDYAALSFYGVSLNIPYDQRITSNVQKPLSSSSIAKWWETVAGADYKKTIKYMESAVSKNGLGDWGYVLLLERFTAKLKGDNPEQKMLVWFFLIKNGYDAKLGYTKDGQAKVMVPSDSSMYGVSFYKFNGIKYYVIDTFEKKSASSSLYTYEGKYPDSNKKIALKRMSAPKLTFSGYARDLSFEYKKQKYTVKSIINKYDVAYFNSFPQSELSVYTSAAKPEWVEQTVLPALKDAVKGKSLDESVNLLLRFVQTAFEYKTDDNQFGKEKFLFAEETIYYPYSDCEDRSIFFAYLVKNLLNVDVVMLNFPNHVATAVDLGDKTQGAYLSYKGKKYTVADPTYINATVGMVMPQFKGVSPEIEETGI